jgi:hypothetical protein
MAAPFWGYGCAAFGLRLHRFGFAARRGVECFPSADRPAGLRRTPGDPRANRSTGVKSALPAHIFQRASQVGRRYTDTCLVYHRHKFIVNLGGHSIVDSALSIRSAAPKHIDSASSTLAIFTFSL